MIQNKLPENCQRILVTGGAGFIGGGVVQRILNCTQALVFNLDKCGYASDLTCIGSHPRHQLLRADLADAEATAVAVQHADPDLVMHLAAESHVDRSIEGPAVFIQSNVVGTFNLLEAIRNHWSKLSPERQAVFRFHHISTDEVFGSLGQDGRFSETTSYNPTSPYSASKAASDHLVRAWHSTYGLPVLISNCSNNFGPRQFPEKLIPLTIKNALSGKSIPIYGDGSNVRDWLFVEDHIDALLMIAASAKPGKTYCIGGRSERTNKYVVDLICRLIDTRIPQYAPHARLIDYIADRPGHDRRYAVDSRLIFEDLGWYPRHTFEEAIEKTIDWYINKWS